MIEIPEKITPPYTGRNVLSVNAKVQKPLERQNVMDLNRGGNRCRPQASYTGRPAAGSRAADPQDVMRGPVYGAMGGMRNTVSGPINRPQPQMPPPVSMPAMPAPMSVPRLQHPLRKGQKSVLYPSGQMPGRISVCFGWNIKDPRVDLDASVFPVGASGRVPDDSWFVFYGQEESPDRSIRFIPDASPGDRERIEVDLVHLDPQIRKLVFVLTINEAFENHLNFSMLGDAYIRVMDQRTRQELVSFKLEEYYSNCTSMTVGELYLHNGQWKFNPVGNGVNQDLAGQCRIYGVEIG